MLAAPINKTLVVTAVFVLAAQGLFCLYARASSLM